MPACAVDEQKAEFDADDGNGESDAGPVELLQFVGQSVRHGEEKEGQQDDAERDRVGDEEETLKLTLAGVLLATKWYSALEQIARVMEK